MGQIAPCQYIGSFWRAQYAPPGGGGKMTLAKKKKKKRSSAQQAAQPQVQQPLGACARTCDSAHAQPCGRGRGYLSRPYQLNPLLWKISVWGSFTSGEDERHRKRERDPFPRGNRVTENHRQPSCLAFSFIQTPNSPLQQITFQQGRLFCL